MSAFGGKADMGLTLMIDFMIARAGRRNT